MCFLLFTLLPTCGYAGPSERPELVFYNWTAYVAKGVIEEFEKTRNVTVRQEYFQSSDERDERVMRSKGKGFDVIMINGNDVVPYARRGWIIPLGVEKVPNLARMTKQHVSGWPDTEKYAVPYLWGTLGIIYRADLIGEEITSWKQFYTPKEAWRGKIMLVDIHRLGIGMALKSLGYSLNSEDPKAIDAAIAVLQKQKNYVQTYGYLKTDADSGIVSGETWMGQTWNGDALLLQKRNPQIRYVVPEEGGEIWGDYMVVSAFSEHPDLAIDFMNYLSEASNSAKASEELAFATPNIDAQQMLPESILKNEVIFPPENALQASEMVKDISPQIKKRMVEAWATITH
ncbi:polyamine ABC transporter substrate-binding protein [Desulfovibrio inopinatus]|uniref:polyamine ABC transporter substrate-binding protein n=1 Tax=Desulfovibrio inopinatus TaxID=102109 RepID=UPI0004074F9A|nr:spermidine/putrescine ABC transporter substrate-binding protein [Desulfovibrio inopinatus]